MYGFAINNETIRSANPLPFLTYNPDIGVIKIMAKIKSISKSKISQGKKIECPYCGDEFIKSNKRRKYCSIDCQEKFYRKTDKVKAQARDSEKKRRDALPDSMVKKVIYIGSKGAIKYNQMTPEMIIKKRVSILAFRKRQKEPSKEGSSCKVWFKECDVCGEMFTARRPDAKYCSDECRYRKSRRYKKERYKKTWIPPEPFKCKECGKLHQPRFKDSKRRVFCSERCEKRYRNKIYGKDARKRARYFNVEYEPVNVFKVFRRDNWHCQICGKITPKKNRGTRYSNAPELDHRIPISKGGGHLYSNVQCACRKCNGLKSNNNNLGQIPLFEVCLG